MRKLAQFLPDGFTLSILAIVILGALFPCRDEFGIDPREAEEVNLRAPVVMGISFSVGSLIPIVAYLVPLSMTASTLLALALAIVGLFVIGYYAARNTDRNPVSKGLEIVAWGVVVFVLSYAAGHFIPPLFGHAPVSVGG